ncbi:MAG: hypothetical protein NZ898_05600 [Myxococcota bacterium]|nr:hypothetical protein [Myxococcota bacterium]MDW8362388.1 hypothetical protein [Myxococcales bacterium]
MTRARKGTAARSTGRARGLAGRGGLWLALFCTSCSSETGAPPVPRAEPSEPVTEAARRADAEPLYDAQGRLLESSTTVAGLRMPRGLVAEASSGRIHVWTTEVPFQKLLEYFGPRLETTEVERIGAAVRYRAAAPRGVRGGVVRLDVTLLPYTPTATRLTVEELPPPSTLGPAELEAQLQRDMQRWD